MNYDDLRSRFVGLLKRRDLTTADRDAYLQSALSRCQTDLRVPAMEQVDTITFDASYGGKLPVPADYLKMKALTQDSQAFTLKQKDLAYVLSLRKRIGNPTAYVRRGGDFWLGPYPQDGTALTIEYYAELPALVNGTDTNWLSEIRPYAILYAALSEAAPFFVDRRGETWEQKYQQHTADLQEQADEDELVNAATEPTYYYPDDDC